MLGLVTWGATSPREGKRTVAKLSEVVTSNSAFAAESIEGDY